VEGMEQVSSAYMFLAQTGTLKSTIPAPTPTSNLKSKNVTEGKETASTKVVFTKDKVELSLEGIEKSENNSAEDTSSKSAETSSSSEDRLAIEDLENLRLLKIRDREVRNHEQAHLSAAGRYSRGGASFSFKKGPDGHSYAVGGAVSIDVSRESSPEATILKMQTVRRAALAPQNPSASDRRIAVQASINESKARQLLQHQLQEEILVAYLNTPENPVSQNPVTTSSPPYYTSLTEQLEIYKEMSAQ
jgi:hypothetical protein